MTDKKPTNSKTNVLRPNFGGSAHKPVTKRPAPQQTAIDPDVEYLAAALQRSRLSDQQIADKVGAARHSKMSSSTVMSFRELAVRRVRRPSNYTVQWIAFALGLSRIWSSAEETAQILNFRQRAKKWQLIRIMANKAGTVTRVRMTA